MNEDELREHIGDFRLPEACEHCDKDLDNPGRGGIETRVGKSLLSHFCMRVVH